MKNVSTHDLYEAIVLAEKQAHIRAMVTYGVWGLESKLSEDNRKAWGSHGSGQRLLILKFLDEYDVWDTNFKILSDCHGGVMRITWGEPNKDDMWASVYHQTGSDFMKTKEMWSVYAQTREFQRVVNEKGEGSEIPVFDDFKKFTEMFK